jgi:hypothetical protein
MSYYSHSTELFSLFSFVGTVISCPLLVYRLEKRPSLRSMAGWAIAVAAALAWFTNLLRGYPIVPHAFVNIGIGIAGGIAFWAVLFLIIELAPPADTALRTVLRYIVEDFRRWRRWTIAEREWRTDTKWKEPRRAEPKTEQGRMPWKVDRAGRVDTPR